MLVRGLQGLDPCLETSGRRLGTSRCLPGFCGVLSRRRSGVSRAWSGIPGSQRVVHGVCSVIPGSEVLSPDAAPTSSGIEPTFRELGMLSREFPSSSQRPGTLSPDADPASPEPGCCLEMLKRRPGTSRRRPGIQPVVSRRWTVVSGHRIVVLGARTVIQRSGALSPDVGPAPPDLGRSSGDVGAMSGDSAPSSGELKRHLQTLTRLLQRSDRRLEILDRCPRGCPGVRPGLPCRRFTLIGCPAAPLGFRGSPRSCPLLLRQLRAVLALRRWMEREARSRGEPSSRVLKGCLEVRAESGWILWHTQP